eukprot:TRINITY_DN1119_c0_g1_i3.p1 TRINITY_DN1119_c0_g1~~TRINITY_DN1119_c0_g1_i3.p1  ORF type:complete len:251 (+),score=40.04 TRINITY_DN1119_c0_g1_i3:340-1092(+)
MCLSKQGLLPGAKDFLRRVFEKRQKILFLSNSSQYSRTYWQARLRSHGLDIPKHLFYTGSIAAAAFIKNQHPNPTAYVIGSSDLKKKLVFSGVKLTEIAPDYVVIGEQDFYTTDQITLACNLVRQGAKLIGTNQETSYLERESHDIVPSCAAWMSIIERTTQQPAYFTGKPNPLYIRNAMNILNLHTYEISLIGNRMDNDIQAGIEANISTVLVSKENPRSNKWGYYPYMLVEDIGKLFPEKTAHNTITN